MPVLYERIHGNCIREGDHLIWQGSVDKDGFPLIKLNGKTVLAHRAIYEVEVGPIDPELDLVQICDIRRCLDTSHMQQMTQSERQIRSRWAKNPNCKRGHPKEEFAVRDSEGHLRCIACARETAKQRYHTKQAAAS